MRVSGRCQGNPGPETVEDRKAFVAQHPTWPAWRLAARLGLATRTVERYRRRIREGW